MSAVDLDALKIERASAPARRPRRWGVIALGVVVLFVAGTFLVPLLRPVQAVRVAPIRVTGEGADAPRVGVVEAAGWIEPEPFPVFVRPLVAGVLTELLVLEGQQVEKGRTVLARLESASLLARRDRAAADVALQAAILRLAEADADVAASLLDQKGALRLSLAERRQAAIRQEAELEVAKRESAAAVAHRDARKAELDGQERLLKEGASYPVALERARAALRAAEAEVESRAVDRQRIEDELAETRALLRIAEELEKDPRALQGRLASARADVEHKRAQLESARVELRIAERELGWCQVKAPMDGSVLRLLAAPGETVGPDGKGIVALYDPAHLQARIDVPLASLGGVRVGQEVEVRSEVAPGKVARGTVLRIQRESDLLKNTTQVKVRLEDPSPLLVPETLCRARFLGGRQEAGPSDAPQLFRIPRAALRGSVVFVVDPTDGGRARRVAVEQVGESEGDLIVKGALSVTQRVILDDVEEGQRVRETQ